MQLKKPVHHMTGFDQSACPISNDLIKDGTLDMEKP